MQFSEHSRVETFATTRLTFFLCLGITDKVAKESSDSTASSHKLHDEDNQATSGGNVAAAAHKANPV